MGVFFTLIGRLFFFHSFFIFFYFLFFIFFGGGCCLKVAEQLLISAAVLPLHPSVSNNGQAAPSIDDTPEEKIKAYSTWYSQAVSHPSTNQARPCLASEIRRDRACSGWYGRKRKLRL